MTKWADYGISAVRFNSAGTHIDLVRAHVDNGSTIEASSDYARATIVTALNNGTTFVTMTRNAAGDWIKGASVFVIRIGTVDYIKSVADNRASDNLDNLPKF
jgi:hypothetical protein